MILLEEPMRLRCQKSCFSSMSQRSRYVGNGLCPNMNISPSWSDKKGPSDSKLSSPTIKFSSKSNGEWEGGKNKTVEGGHVGCALQERCHELCCRNSNSQEIKSPFQGNLYWPYSFYASRENLSWSGIVIVDSVEEALEVLVTRGNCHGLKVCVESDSLVALFWVNNVSAPSWKLRMVLKHVMVWGLPSLKRFSNIRVGRLIVLLIPWRSRDRTEQRTWWHGCESSLTSFYNPCGLTAWIPDFLPWNLVKIGSG